MNPNNTKLLDLINTYHKQEENKDNYMNVIQELINGNSMLLLPSANDTPEEQKALSEAGHTKTLKLSSVFNHDGIRTLCVFTDEETLSDWAKKPMPYKMLASKDVLQLCEMSSIQRIVINTGTPTIFVLEQSKK